MNRVADAIERYRKAIGAGQKVDGSGPIEAEALAALDKSLDNTFAEVAAYQSMKSRAQVAGIITVDEAMTIYAALGGESAGQNGWAPGVDIATKVVVTNVMATLISTRK